MNFEPLFEPIQMAGLTIKNRFVMPAMDSGTTTEGHEFSEQSIAYFKARAAGEFGLVITEYMAVAPDGIGNPREVGIWDDTFIPSLAALTAAVHSVDGRIFAQLHHSGMMCESRNTGVQPTGPSAISSPNYREPVRALTNVEVHHLIGQYIAAGVRAAAAGFDGVEVHGAHGYLIAQFLSKAINKRSDEFGGTYADRFRFADAVIRGLKDRLGPDFPVGFRISADEFMDSGNTPTDAVVYAMMAESAGADYIHVSTGTGIGGNIVTPLYFDPGFNVVNAELIKRRVTVPVLAVGRINDPLLALEIVTGGRADMVSLGRQSVADAEFPKKVKENRLDEIFYCTGCMQRCYYSKGCEPGDTGISCLINPLSGKEFKWRIEPAANAKSITVVGAGPAGLQFAWIAAQRGHRVTVFEKEITSGGNYRWAAVPPKKEALAKTIGTYETLCRKHGVELRHGTEVQPETLSTSLPDAVVLATGSIPLLPPIPGLDPEDCIKATDILSGARVIAGQRILILGGGLIGCETAEFLNTFNNRITVVDRLSEFAAEAVKRSRVVLLQRLAEAHTSLLPDTNVLEVLPDGIRASRNGEEILLDGFDAVVIALGVRSHNPLETAARASSPEVHVIGDALAPRDATAGIYEATKLALSI